MPVMMRPVPGFPGYHAGSNGTVWSAWKTRRRSGGGRGVEGYISETMKLLRLKPHSAGYLAVSFRRDGKAYDFLVHRLILETFVGPCPDGEECLHHDNDKHNNRLHNLRWGTRLENVADSIRHGTFYNATKAAAKLSKGKPRSQEVRDKIAAGHKGKPKSEEHKAAIKAAHWSKGPNAEEVAARMAESLRGRNLTEEHKAKISASTLGVLKPRRKE